MPEYLHQPWCAAVIAENAMLPWRVRCDCKPKKPKEPKPMPLWCDTGEKKDVENG